MTTPKMDRRVAFDERSRAYGIRPLVAGAVRQTTLHDVPRPLPLDQGSEGACVGFGWSAQLAVGPIFNPASNLYAQAYYQAARTIDQLAGRYFPDGASVLAGAEVGRRRGLFTGYRWAFGVDDVIDTICAKGPVVLGLDWYEGMYQTEDEGRVRIHGARVGGHCILATGYVHGHPRWGGNWVRWTNSWGHAYGVQGNGFIRVDDLAGLLAANGEACIADEVAPVIPRPRLSWWRRLLP